MRCQIDKNEGVCSTALEMDDDTHDDERLADVVEEVEVGGPPLLFGELEEDELECVDD